MVGTEVRCVGVDASRDVLRAEGVVRLNDYLIDDAEMQVVNQESHLFAVARILRAEALVYCSRCIEYYLQLLFGKLVVVDFHCFGDYRVKHS